MRQTAVIKRLDDKFPKGPPSDEDVRRQSVRFYREHWLKRWPDLDVPPSLQLGPGIATVTRQELFDQAKNLQTEDDAIDLYVLMASWGSGTKSREITRRIRVLEQKGAARALLRSADAAQKLDPVEAYRRLLPGGEDRVVHFGPSFFTKWLYFSAYETKAPGQRRPMILDERVAGALGWDSSRRSAEDYGGYLDFVAALRDSWAPGAEEHVIEYALFRTGRQYSEDSRGPSSGQETEQRSEPAST